MFPRKTLATVCLGTALTAAAFGTSAAATAAPAPTPARASTAPATDVTTTPTIDGTRAVITITGQKGQKIVIRDAGQRAIAGTTLTAPTTTLTFTAPTSKPAYTVDIDGTPQTSAAFTLRDDIVTPTDKPTVDDVDTTGTRAIVDVTAAPRAIVKVKNDDGDILGLRLADATGHVSIPIPVATDTDTPLKVSQTVGATESDEADAASLIEIKDASVLYAGRAAATVKVELLALGEVKIFDEDGTEVQAILLDSNGLRDLYTVPLVAGRTNVFDVVRTNSLGSSKPVRLTVPGDAAALSAPSATVANSTAPLVLRGVPGARFHVVGGGRDVHVGSLETGTAVFADTTPGATYAVTQEIGTEVSPSFSVTVPAT
ncbi:hypothetical protein [Frondihabitans cladoniiphilus]|uniref:Uncharacterized protein n=1 Tax=Frondihabitans cladoniiphilus TaxID=715785 RepID=A0ABP8W334_9MICO